MSKWLAVVFLVLLVLAGAMGLKSLVTHPMLANTTSPPPRVAVNNGAAPPPVAR